MSPIVSVSAYEVGLLRSVLTAFAFVVCVSEQAPLEHTGPAVSEQVAFGLLIDQARDVLENLEIVLGEAVIVIAGEGALSLLLYSALGALSAVPYAQ
jgi:enamine deaminase RidA (YjgF/YER057c/UK114 family)